MQESKVERWSSSRSKAKWYAWVARGYADGEEINVKFYKILVIIHDLPRLQVNHPMPPPGGNCNGASKRSTLQSLTYPLDAYECILWILFSRRILSLAYCFLTPKPHVSRRDVNTYPFAQIIPLFL